MGMGRMVFCSKDHSGGDNPEAISGQVGHEYAPRAQEDVFPERAAAFSSTLHGVNSIASGRGSITTANTAADSRRRSWCPAIITPVGVDPTGPPSSIAPAGFSGIVGAIWLWLVQAFSMAPPWDGLPVNADAEF